MTQPQESMHSSPGGRYQQIQGLMSIRALREALAPPAIHLQAVPMLRNLPGRSGRDRKHIKTIKPSATSAKILPSRPTIVGRRNRSIARENREVRFNIHPASIRSSHGLTRRAIKPSSAGTGSSGAQQTGTTVQNTPLADNQQKKQDKSRLLHPQIEPIRARCAWKASSTDALRPRINDLSNVIKT